MQEHDPTLVCLVVLWLFTRVVISCNSFFTLVVSIYIGCCCCSATSSICSLGEGRKEWNQRERYSRWREKISAVLITYSWQQRYWSFTAVKWVTVGFLPPALPASLPPGLPLIIKSSHINYYLHLQLHNFIPQSTFDLSSSRPMLYSRNADYRDISKLLSMISDLDNLLAVCFRFRNNCWISNW